MSVANMQLTVIVLAVITCVVYVLLIFVVVVCKSSGTISGTYPCLSAFSTTLISFVKS